MGPCRCWDSGVGVTEGHLIEAVGRVPVGVVGCVVGQPPNGRPFLGQGKGGALKQGGLQAAKYLSLHVMNAMSVG